MAASAQTLCSPNPVLSLQDLAAGSRIVTKPLQLVLGFTLHRAPASRPTKIVKRIFVLLASLSILLCTPLTFAQITRESRNDFLRENRTQFPLVEMKRAEIPFAAVHHLSPRAEPLEYVGRYYTGFRFTTPAWLDAPVIWMFACKGPAEVAKGMNFYILPEEPLAVEFKLGQTRREADHFPRFRKLFPDSGSFTFQHFPQESLLPAKNYIVWFGFPSKKIPEIGFALTVGSAKGVYECGMLPTGYPDNGPGRAFLKNENLKPKTAAAIVSATVATYRKSGSSDALALLDRELSAYIDAAGDFRQFYLAVWGEAQTGSGRTDPAWSASLFEWLQLKCRSLDAFVLAEDLVPNTTNGLNIAHRYGAASRALEPFIEEMGRRLVEIDPAAYPDQGPAMPLLPEVRLRSYPMVPTRGVSVIGPDGWVGVSQKMPKSFAGGMTAMADLELLGGNWQKSLERNFAVCDWVERMRDQTFEPENHWYSNRAHIAQTLMTLGLFEAADGEYDAILRKGWPDIYQNATLIRSRFARLSISISLGTANETVLKELDEIHEKLRNNPYVHSGSWEAVEITKAHCLDQLGRHEEAITLLAKLIESGNHEAHVERIRLQLAAGELGGIESELQAVLQITRDWGRKIDEADLYSLYARFLENSGRTGEALTMQREAVRLSRGFNLFAKLPGELARLSVLLAKYGDGTGSDTAAAEANRLIAHQERIPARIAKEVTVMLASRAPAEVRDATPTKPAIDLQPLRSLLIPVKGRPLRANLTLSNPSAQAVEGTLAFDGIPAAATWDAGSGEASVTLGTSGTARLSKIRIEPGSLALIQLSAAADAISKGTLTAVWSMPGQKDRQSVWSFDAAEEGVSSAVIEAGEFKSNPFYSVPIHHHFIPAEGSTLPANFRITTSSPARVELYDAEDRLISVDAKGDSSLGDAGDSLFSDVDGDGAADFPAGESETSFRIQVYPSGKIAAEGLSVKLEGKLDGQWVVVAEDRILP